MEFSKNRNIIQGRGRKKETCVFHLVLIYSLSIFNLNGQIGTTMLDSPVPCCREAGGPGKICPLSEVPGTATTTWSPKPQS